jgi:6-phosphogluconolactonase
MTTTPPYTVFDSTDDLFLFLANELKRYSYYSDIQHIALSGGSTPKGLFEFIVNSEFKNSILWSNLHFWWGDERCVDFCDQQSNYGEAKRLLFDHVDISSGNLHFMPVDKCNSIQAYKKAVESFTKEMSKYLNKNKSYPQFDWILLGIGDDGHTASLFPGVSDLEAPSVALFVLKPNTSEYRISLSANTLRMAKRISYLVTGQSKASVVADIIQERGTFKSYPAYLIRAQSGSTEYLLDLHASSLLVS